MNRYEKSLHELSWARNDIREIFSQISCSTRQSRQIANQHEKVIWETSTNVIGPLYVAFVWWIIKKAEQEGIQRLYFMARDGLILKDIADIIISKSGHKIDPRYLFVSRQSLLYASIKDVDSFDMRWMMWNPLTPLPARKILSRMEIDPEHIKTELTSRRISNLDKNLSLTEKFRFREIFSEPRVKSLIIDNAKLRQKTTLAYLHQEGLTEDVPFALVDLGWLALSQYALSRLLDHYHTRPKKGVKGFYLGTNWLLWKYKNDQTESFMYNPQNMLWRMPVVQYELPEIFTTASCGRTLGYEQHGEQIVPALGGINKKALEWGSETQKAGVLAFTQKVVEAIPAENWRQESPSDTIRKIFDLFCNWPSLEEANVYGSFVHGADIEEKDGHEIAPKTTCKDLPRILTGYYWVQGTLSRSNLLFKLQVSICFPILNFARHIFILSLDILFLKKDNYAQ